MCSNIICIFSRKQQQPSAGLTVLKSAYLDEQSCRDTIDVTVTAAIKFDFTV